MSCLPKGWSTPGNGQHPVRLFVGERDGERRYAKELWKLATLRLSYAEVSVDYGHFKVWREGLEVAIKIKGSHMLAAGGVVVLPEHPLESDQSC